MLDLAKLLFCGVTIVGSAYFLLRQRQFDFCSLGFFSALVYFSPGFIGVTYVPGTVPRIEEIVSGAYHLMTGILLIVLVTTFVFDSLFSLKTSGPLQLVRMQGDRFFPQLALLIGCASCCGTLYEIRSVIGSAEKEDLLQHLGRWQILFEFSISFAVLGLLQRKRYFALAVASCLLLFEVFLGFRTAAVTTLLAVVLVQVQRHGKFRLYRQTKLLLLLATAFLFALLVKQFLYSIRYGAISGDSSLFFEQLTNPDSYFFAVISSEPSITVTTLSAIVQAKYSVPISHLADVMNTLLPFSNELGGQAKGFNAYFQPALFPDVDFGMANNIWAEMYAVGQYSGAYLFALLFSLGLCCFSLASRHVTGSLQVMVILSGVYWAFYIHRNDLLYQCLLERRVLFTYLMIYGVSWAVVLSCRKSPAIACQDR
jgi:hypothetical protein